MDRTGFKKGILAILSLAVVLWSAVEVLASVPNFDFDILSHRLVIQIDPSRHYLKAEDRIEISIKSGKPQSISFLLNPKLKITRVVDAKTGQPLNWSEASFSSNARRLDVSLQKLEAPLQLSISYEGPIYDPVVKEKELQFVRGDQTSGLIGPEGVYLTASTHWYPDRPGSLSRFRVEANILDPFRIVTQGELVSENLKDGIWTTKWVYDLPDESLVLVAGKYSVQRKEAEGIKISTYFFPEDDRFSEIFLNAAEEYLRIYSGLLGPYPYKKFDIVQNFFSSGYGIPTFTLLAPETIRQGKEFLRPGALNHEIVHSWWGHYVSLKPGTGNWVEALTTYCTNYYYKEWKIGEDVARKHRQDVMQKYAIQVPASKDYPLRKFEGKDSESDAQIGYGKGSMVFHMLRTMVGKDLFFATLRKFALKYGGKQASWEEIQRIFEEASSKGLDGFFSQWLDRPGGPQLRIENVKVQTTSTGYAVSGEVVQEGDVYQLTAPVEVDDGSVKKSLLLEVSKRRNPFSLEIPKLPLKLALDPDYHLFRRLTPEEIIPGFNALLEDREKIFIVTDQGDDESRKIYLELARKTREQKGGEILPIREVTEERLRHSSVMLLGEDWRNPVIAKLFSNLPKPIERKGGLFFVKGAGVKEENESLLLTFPHPLNQEKWVTLYFGRSAGALSRARYIFFYGWDSYLLFKSGRPKERGNLPPRNSFSEYGFIGKDYFAKIEPQRLRETISFLASPELAGRFPETPGYQKARAYLIRQLETTGIKPVIQPFTITVKDIIESTVLLKGPNRSEKIKALPFRFSRDGKWQGEFLLIGQSENVEKDNLSGKGAMVFIDVTKGGGHEHVFRKIKELQLQKAKAALFFVQEEDLDLLAPYITYPSYFPPQLDDRLRRREKEGHSVQPLIEASKVAARAVEPDFPIHIPVAIVPYSQSEGGCVKDIFKNKKASFEVHLEFKVTSFKDENIIGVLEGHDPEKKKEFLVLGAHYDHLGKDAKSGFYYSGADDNGSGVSALLEIGRSLMRKRTDLRRSVLFVFFGGEEWGLWGSRHLVDHPIVPLNQIKAMFSLDTVGGITGEKEIFFVGGSVYPSLAQRCRRFVEPLGFREGRNIDRHSFEFGSDHYPFHQKGIPALDFFASDYKKMHTSHDRPEAIDFEKLADVTRLVYLTAYEFLTEP
jgi:hypothetical protein